tara:strand:+ start:101 stop:295 length:195 start_codon:yes stop_codon:yes gene_type:complete
MIITSRSASAVQAELISAGIFMVDMGATGKALTGYRFQFNHAGEVEQFVTLAQVKTWAKYNLPA